MNQYIFSPLAVMCGLTALYSSSGELDRFSTVGEPAYELSIEPLMEPLVKEEQEDLLTLLPSFSQDQKVEEQVVFERDYPDWLELEEWIEKELSLEASVDPFYETEVSSHVNPPLASHNSTAIETSSKASFPLNDPLLVSNQNTPTMQSNTVEENVSFLSLGGTYTYTHIKPHGHASFHGNLGGIEGLYEYRPCNRIYGGLKLAWRQGETETSGATRFLVDVTAEERLGYTWTLDKDHWLWTLFTGFGYRYLGHHLKESSNTLRFNYNEFYCPVGLFTDYQFYPWLSFGLHVTWMPQIFPTVTIVPLGGARWGTSYSVGNILAEAPLNFFVGDNQQFFLTINPSFQYWEDGHTTATTSTGEQLGLPGNTYLFWGVDVRLGYAF